MKKNTNVILAITIGVLCMFGVISSSTYSLWQVTKTQKNANIINSACLDITMQNETGTYELNNAWPITDDEGEKLVGYNFEIKNNCDTPVNYMVGLNSLGTTESKIFNNTSIKVKLDEENAQIYGDLNVIENPEVLSSRLISRQTIAGNATNSHNIKVWVSEDAPVSEQSKEFEGQVFVTAGQGILSYDECFTVSSDGTLNDYNTACGTSIKIPAVIKGIEIKKINMSRFDGVINVLDLSELKNIETIEAFSFEDIGLQKVILPENGKLTNIKEYAFYQNNINSINISNTITNIGRSAFGYNDLTEITIPSSVENIESSAFAENKISRLVFEDTAENPSKITEIKCGTFDGNNISGVLILPKSLQIIDIEAFDDNNIEKLEIPDSVTEIKNSAFNSNNIKTLKLPKNLKSIEINAFRSNEIEELFIPASTQVLGTSAFEDNNITSVIIEDTLEKPSQLKTISGQVFEWNNLTGTFVIPKSVTSIGSSVFAGNGKLKEIIIKRTEEDALANVTFASNWTNNGTNILVTVTYNPN